MIEGKRNDQMNITIERDIKIGCLKRMTLFESETMKLRLPKCGLWEEWLRFVDPELI